MKRTEAIAWLEVMKEDAIFEQNDALKMAIEALQTAEINCVHCPRYYETEDDIGVHSHCGSHDRLIDANALMEYCSNQKTKTISNNDIARFPTVSPDRPQGEWIDKGDYAICSKCGGSSGTQYDGVERIPRITAFCPHCGRRRKGAEHEID